MAEADWFSWAAGGLAISLMIGSFLMMFTTIFTTRKRPKDQG